ncbi:MAG: mechanosensitive ion channel, partial [Planctomycetes bacterium]|nr:mechanosensitive ion channel [Planctomycetota bacterium]
AQVELLNQALASLTHAAESRAKTQQFLADASEAPRLLNSLLEELATPPTEPELHSDPEATLWELENRAAQAQANWTALRDELTELENTAQTRAQRLVELPEQIASASRTLTSFEESLASMGSEEETRARRTLLLAQVDEYRALTEALEAERAAYDARREVLPKRKERALRRASQAQTIANFWKGEAEARRAQEADNASQTAKEQLAEVSVRFPSLALLAAQVQDLAAQRSGENGLPRRISLAQAATGETRALLEEIRARFRSAQRRVHAGGLTEGMGLILRRDYEWLPKPRDLRSQSNARKKKLSAVQLDIIATQEASESSHSLDEATDLYLAELGAANPSDALRSATRELVAAQRAAHQDLLRDLEQLSLAYTENEELANTLGDEAQAYRDYIEKRILWVRTSPLNPLPRLAAVPGDAIQIAQGVAARAQSLGWKGLFERRGGPLIAIALAWVALFLSRRRLRRSRRRAGENVRSFRTDKYSYTGHALLQTALLALPWPALAATVGWILNDSRDELVRAAGSGLLELAVIWLFLRVVWEMTGENGVGSLHFKWPAARMASIRKQLRWFEPVAVLVGFCVLTLDRQANTDWTDSVGRLAFIGGMAALATFIHRLAVAERDRASGSEDVEEPEGLGWKSNIAITLPVALALMALAGYFYTALQFELRLRYSIGYGALLVLINALLHRWLLMTRRKLAVKQAIEARARREAEEEAKGTGEVSHHAIDADKVDIPAIDAQTRQLFRTSISLATIVGLFFIWAGVLPALRGLDSIQILPTFDIVSPGAELSQNSPVAAPITPAADGAQDSGEASTPLPIPSAKPATTEGTLGLPTRLTLADILLAIGFGLLAAFAAKNLPALLELAVLQRLPLDGGARYAVSTIVRYLILIAGVSAVSSALGIGWHHVQWLAAALTFGIAFGLQEIFANFISGLIILIERPIRVGDIVTVGGTEGRVTQLRMRATTIMDWDQRELLVPNKEFITGSIINWTLSDPITRMVVPVGIAYGSDTRLARKLLLDVAKANPKVLQNPEPSAIFRSFGDSTLDFNLRVFIANRDLWAEITDNLHSQIDATFRKHGIEIAFPQRDLHIRTAEGLRQLDREFDAAEEDRDGK